MKLASLLRTGAVVGALQFASAGFAAALIVESGELKGATGVDVNGTLYDVSFVEGSCVALFSGCDSSSDFDFATELEAEFAAVALLSQVFVDTASGAFDAVPALTAGCELPSDYCYARVPYALLPNGTGYARIAYNNSGAAADFTGLVNFGPTHSTLPENYTVYADFTLSAAPGVPEPATWAMMIIGFGFVGSVIRASKKRDRVHGLLPRLTEA